MLCLIYFVLPGLCVDTFLKGYFLGLPLPFKFFADHATSLVWWKGLKRAISFLDPHSLVVNHTRSEGSGNATGLEFESRIFVL